MNCEMSVKPLPYKYDTKVLGGSDKEIYTSIPNRAISIIPGESIDIIYYGKDTLLMIDANFTGLKDDNSAYYSFIINRIIEKENLRQGSRRNTLEEAMALSKEFYQIITILDISDNGLRIKTENRIPDEEFKIILRDGEVRKQVVATVIWETVIDGSYFYGLTY